jgi:hypothetical protein
LCRRRRLHAAWFFRRAGRGSNVTPKSVPSRDKTAARHILGKIYQRKSIEARAVSEMRVTTAGCQSIVATHGSPSDTPVASSAISTDLIAKPARKSTAILKKSVQAQMSFESFDSAGCGQQVLARTGSDAAAETNCPRTTKSVALFRARKSRQPTISLYAGRNPPRGGVRVSDDGDPDQKMPSAKHGFMIYLAHRGADDSSINHVGVAQLAGLICMC